MTSILLSILKEHQITTQDIHDVVIESLLSIHKEYKTPKSDE